MCINDDKGLYLGGAKIRGSFVSVPAVFAAVDEGLRHVFKMEISAETGTGPNGEVRIQSMFSTDRAMIDFGALDPAAIDLKRVERDCDLVKTIVQKYPKEVKGLLETFSGAGGLPVGRIEATYRELEGIGLTESAVLRQDGGFLALLVLLGAALVAGCGRGCAHGSNAPGPVTPPH